MNDQKALKFVVLEKNTVYACRGNFQAENHTSSLKTTIPAKENDKSDNIISTGESLGEFPSSKHVHCVPIGLGRILRA